MDTRKPTNFRIRMDEDRPEPVISANRNSLRLDRLNRQIVLIFVLMICIVGVGFFMFYTDTQKRLELVRGTGSMQLDGISKSIDERIRELAKSQQELMETQKKINDGQEKLAKDLEEVAGSVRKMILPMDEIFLSMEKTTASVKKDLQKINGELEQLKAGTDADKKTAAETIDRLEESLATVAKSIETYQGEVKALIEIRGGEIETINRTLSSLREEIEKNQADISTISSGKIYRQVIAIMLGNQEKKFDAKLDELRKSLAEIKSRTDHIDREMRKIEKSMKPSAGNVYKKPAPHVPSSTGSPPEDGIIEKDL